MQVVVGRMNQYDSLKKTSHISCRVRLTRSRLVKYFHTRQFGEFLVIILVFLALFKKRKATIHVFDDQTNSQPQF